MSLNVSLHPLVIMNISDQFTRTRVQYGKARRIVGALFGKQKSRNVEIYNSFELPYEETKGGGIKMKEEYIVEQSELYQKLFPEFEVIGWYSTGAGGPPLEQDKEVHRHMMKYNENPLYLLLNPQASALDAQIPVMLFEGGVQIIQNVPVFSFNPIPLKIATMEAERVALEDVARSTDTSGATSKYNTNLASTLNAVKMLKGKLGVLLDLIKREPQVLQDPSFIRQISCICSRLPIFSGEELMEELNSEYAGTILLNHIGTLTKSLQMMKQLLGSYGKFSKAKEKKRGRGMMLGMGGGLDMFQMLGSGGGFGGF